MIPAYWEALAGGMLIGTAAILLLLMNGRIAGVSGIVGRLLGGQGLSDNALFVVGLLLGPLVYALLMDGLPPVSVSATWPVVALAGLLVGLGTRMGSGCTSGHGILGIARFSKRSVAATATFLATGMLVATLADLLR